MSKCSTCGAEGCKPSNHVIKITGIRPQLKNKLTNIAKNKEGITLSHMLRKEFFKIANKED